MHKLPSLNRLLDHSCKNQISFIVCMRGRLLLINIGSSLEHLLGCLMSFIDYEINK